MTAPAVFDCFTQVDLPTPTLSDDEVRRLFADVVGRNRGTDAENYAPEAVAVIDELAASGRAPAGFIAETSFGNAGGVALPEGYLTEVCRPATSRTSSKSRLRWSSRALRSTSSSMPWIAC